MKVSKLIDIACASTCPVGATLSSFYHGPGHHFMSSYLHDITLPFGGYFLSKLLSPHVGENRLQSIAIGFLGCSAFEVAQGLGLYHGTFDPYDFLAYAAGSGLAFSIDTLRTKNKLGEEK